MWAIFLRGAKWAISLLFYKLFAGLGPYTKRGLYRLSSYPGGARDGALFTVNWCPI